MITDDAEEEVRILLQRISNKMAVILSIVNCMDIEDPSKKAIEDSALVLCADLIKIKYLLGMRND